MRVPGVFRCSSRAARSHRLPVLCVAAVLLSLAAPLGGVEDLAAKFANPSGEYRPWVWAHWLHGNVSREAITRELEAIRRAGLGGVTMFDVAQPGIPPGPHTYLSESWRELFAFEIAEARRFGLEVMTQNGPGYSGNGGPWITPELAAQKIVESAVRVTGGRSFSGRLPQPEANGGFYRDVAVLAVAERDAPPAFKFDDFDMKRLVWLNYIKWRGTRSAPLDATAPPEACLPLDRIIDLTGQMSPDGSLRWEVPAGDWTILRFGHTWTGQKTLPATPEGLGPECNKLDPRGIRAHFDHVMKRMIDLAGTAAGGTFHSFFVDSWEAGGQNWTERMPAEFKRRRGYDLVRFLPVITGRIVGDLQTSERFLYDLRLTVSELMTENFWAELQRLCRAHGMRLAAQPYITTGQDLDAANFIDEPMGECWAIPNTTTDYRQTVKLAASAAQLNGHRVVGVEAFTSTAQEKWRSHPATLKPLADQIFCLGGNRLQVHRFAMQRFPQLRPGLMMGGWGQQYDSTQTWWEWSKPWHDYLARCQLLLRQGPIVADVLIVAPEEPLERFEHTPVPGFDYDAAGPDVFNRTQAEPGVVLLPHGRRYALMMLRPSETMSIGRLRHLRDLINAGANVLGEPPCALAGLAARSEAADEWRTHVAELWGQANEAERRVGRGRVFRGLAPEAVLSRLGIVPDFECAEPLTWIHRTTAEAEIYFIASAAGERVDARCTLRVHGRSAERWDPESGRRWRLPAVPTADRRTTVDVPLGPGGSAFLVFPAPAMNRAAGRRDALADPSAAIASPGETRALAGPWTLAFPADSGAPPTVILERLTPWNRHEHPEIRHFSGTAVYHHSFELDATSPRVLLDLGRVEVMARVRVNQRDLGLLWKPPYRIDISDAVRRGPNVLEIAVVNLWVNRLIGDAALPEDAERDRSGRLVRWPDWVLAGGTSPAGRRTFVTFPLWKAGEPLQDSGLLGPVTLVFPRVPVAAP